MNTNHEQPQHTSQPLATLRPVDCVDTTKPTHTTNTRKPGHDQFGDTLGSKNLRDGPEHTTRERHGSADQQEPCRPAPAGLRGSHTNVWQPPPMPSGRRSATTSRPSARRNQTAGATKRRGTNHLATGGCLPLGLQVNNPISNGPSANIHCIAIYPQIQP